MTAEDGAHRERGEMHASRHPVGAAAVAGRTANAGVVSAECVNQRPEELSSHGCGTASDPEALLS
jgi:hypothetical protein